MSKFVREGLGTIGRGSSIFCITDFFSVLGYYRALKREEDNLPLLIRKEDFGEIPEDVADEIDEIISHILETFETAPTTNVDPIVSVLSGELNMFGYILHDPLLKQALGNVATDAIYRDRRISEEEAYDEAKENLSELFEDFEAFLQEIMTMSLSQIRRKSMVHGVSIVDIRRIMNPKVAEIDPMRGIRLAFEPAFESSAQKENTKSTDNMFG